MGTWVYSRGRVYRSHEGSRGQRTHMQLQLLLAIEAPWLAALDAKRSTTGSSLHIRLQMLINTVNLEVLGCSRGHRGTPPMSSPVWAPTYATRRSSLVGA